jgi:signal transduction histidine kinase
MTIRTRLTLWYAGMLLGSLLLMGGLLHYELVGESERGLAQESPREKIADVLLFYWLPTVFVLVLGGSWFMRRTLRPIEALTAGAERVHAGNLTERIPLTGRGDELDRLASVFNEMLGRIEAGVAGVRDFTLHASHELKTPLTILSIQAEGALSEPTLAPDQRELLESQLEEVRRLAALVDALSLLAKADAGLPIVARELVRLDEMLRVAVADARLFAAKSGITIELTHCDAAPLDGDRASLRQALLNLLDNAVKHNQPGGWVRVELRAAPEDFTLSIENTGAPIPPELVERIFGRFVRGPDACEGSGLGLSITKTIVEAHGGTVACIHRAEGEARFVIHLPRSAQIASD